MSSLGKASLCAYQSFTAGALRIQDLHKLQLTYELREFTAYCTKSK